MATIQSTETTSIFEKTSNKINPLGNLGTGLAIGLQGYKTIQEWNAPDINYDILNLQADYRDNQARQVELDAQEQANYLRAQFSEAVGDYKMNTAQRNIKVDEGSAKMNIEDSAEELGYDMQKMKGNADFQAGLLRDDANRIRAGAESQKELTKWEKIGNLFDNIGTMAGLFGQWQSKKTTETVTKGTKTTETTTKETPKGTPAAKKETLAMDIAPEVDGADAAPMFEMPEDKTTSVNKMTDTLHIGKEYYSKVEIQKMPEEQRNNLLLTSIKDKKMSIAKAADLFDVDERTIAKLLKKEA